MPFGSFRRYRRRRNTRSRVRRTIGGRKMVSRIRMRRTPLNKRPHFFKRQVQLTSIYASPLGDTFGSYVFKLSDVPGYTEFTALYDMFRINKVLLNIEPTWNATDANSTSTLTYAPDVHSVIDYNDSANAGSLNELREYSTYKRTRQGRCHKRIITPAIQTQAYETLTTSAYTPKFRQWLSTDDATSPHYCIKYALDKTATGQTNFTFRVYATYYLEMKACK